MPTILKIAKHEPASFLVKFPYRLLKYASDKYILQKRYSLRKIHHNPMKLRLDDPGISRTLYLIGDREKEHRYILNRLVQPNSTVLDLGANIGYYVLLEHKLLSNNGKIIAVEPHPENFSLLEENIALNKLKNVTAIQAAVTPNDGRTTLHISRYANVHSLINSPHRQQTGKTISVPAISLKTLLDRYDQINFIRMDIEGYEQHILDDVLQLNSHTGFTPTILFELHAKEYDKNKFLNTLQNLFKIGYKAAYLATSSKSSLTKNKIPIVATVPTDGRTRYIASDITFPQLANTIWKSRCLALNHVESNLTND